MTAHESLEEHGPPPGASDRSFGLTVGGIFLLLGIVRGLLGSGFGATPLVLLAVGTLLLATALLDAGASARTGFYDPGHLPEPGFESVLYGAAGVAHDAGLPIVLGYFDYGTKTVGFGPIMWPREVESDMQSIQQFYATKRARRPQNFLISEGPEG